MNGTLRSRINSHSAICSIPHDRYALPPNTILGTPHSGQIAATDSLCDPHSSATSLVPHVTGATGHTIDENGCFDDLERENRPFCVVVMGRDSFHSVAAIAWILPVAGRGADDRYRTHRISLLRYLILRTNGRKVGKVRRVEGRLFRRIRAFRTECPRVGDTNDRDTHGG